jgi:hypothetical protein
VRSSRRAVASFRFDVLLSRPTEAPYF